MKNIKEIWKDVLEFEGYYQVSNLGRVRSIDRKVITSNNRTYFCPSVMLTPKIGRTGYYEVVLTKHDGKRYCKRIHRLVAEAFLENFNNYPFINHINENKLDNRVENLEWCTAKQNIEAYHNSRTLVYQYNFNGELLNTWNSITKAAESVSGDKTGIQHCCKGNLKTYFGFVWSYNVLNKKQIADRLINNTLVKVQQLDKNDNIINTYDSITDAARSVGCNPSAISMACCGLRTIIKGYKWKKL